jgi:predicted nucleotidyltransferase
MILQNLSKRGAISPPNWLIPNCQYLTIMGSDAYGVSSGSSDLDIYGFTIPPRHMIFPHLAGEIPDFGLQQQRFAVWQEHHVPAPDKAITYDFAVYGIVKFAQLCMDNNPNMIDSLFTPRRCVLYSTQIGEHFREHRKDFLHKGAWHKFKGYAYQQMSKIANKVNASNPVRAESIKLYGYDVKFAYHVARLLGEIEQIMIEGDLDLERNREQLKSIRRGEWTIEQLQEYFTHKEKSLETIYASSTLPHRPDQEKIKTILMEALEMHFGNLDRAVARNPSIDQIIGDLRTIVDRYSAKVTMPCESSSVDNPE